MTLDALIKTLCSRTPLPKLSPDQIWRPALKESIGEIEAGQLVKAGLYLWNDDIESCHHIAQAKELPDYNYWHAILHRREKDFSNSKYWYKQVGQHPVLKRVISESKWTYGQFVDECEKAVNKGGSAQALEEWQAKEMAWLLDHCIATEPSH